MIQKWIRIFFENNSKIIKTPVVDLTLLVFI